MMELFVMLSLVVFVKMMDFSINVVNQSFGVKH